MHPELLALQVLIFGNPKLINQVMRRLLLLLFFERLLILVAENTQLSRFLLGGRLVPADDTSAAHLLIRVVRWRIKVVLLLPVLEDILEVVEHGVHVLVLRLLLLDLLYLHVVVPPDNRHALSVRHVNLILQVLLHVPLVGG